MTILSNLPQLQWWQLLILLLAAALFPLFRAIAVVFLAKRVDTKIAKLAIPLILKRTNLFFWRKDQEKKPKKANNWERREDGGDGV